MSEKYPECPLYKHNNCKYLDDPNVCAIVREDKTCLKKDYNKSNQYTAK